MLLCKFCGGGVRGEKVKWFMETLQRNPVVLQSSEKCNGAEVKLNSLSGIYSGHMWFSVSFQTMKNDVPFSLLLLKLF